MTNAAAENFAQHVAAAFVRRKHAIVDEKCSGAGVVSDDAQAGVCDQLHRQLCFELSPYSDFSSRAALRIDQRSEEIRLEVGDLALQDGGHALQAHAGIDGGLGQRREFVAGRLAAASTTAERSNCMKTRFQIST